MNYTDILDFWFTELTPAQWFKRDAEIDRRITERFSDVHALAAAGETEHWRETPEGRLVEIIVLDQFSRNMYRDSARAYACDTQAERLTYEAIGVGADMELPPERRLFLYMPLMHSESKITHRLALKKFIELDNAEALKYERSHKQIIDRFGRYPHRNDVLDRKNTPAEDIFLATHHEHWF